MKKPSYFDLIFENEVCIVECEATIDDEGTLDLDNILVTNKATGLSSEVLELPEGLYATAKAVAGAQLDQ